MSNLYVPEYFQKGLPTEGKLVLPKPTPEAIVPYVIETTSYGEEGYDVFSRLLRERIIFLGTAIDMQVANDIIAHLLYLAYDDPEKDIYLYINSPGGVVYAGLAIYDTMQFVQPDVVTICMGKAASMATVLLCGGADGKRYALPNSTVHQHPPLYSSPVQGSAPDIEIESRMLITQQRRLLEIMAQHTKQPYERLQRDFDRDRFMSPQEAKDYGFIDEIMSRAEIGKTSAA